MKLLEKLSEIISEIDLSIAWFTTFSFSPAFFEKYILATLFEIKHDLKRLEDYEAINEKLKTTDVKVFYDPVGLNITEGKKTTCDFIPVYGGLKNLEQMDGLFHPKVCFLYGTTKENKEKTAYLITGSANLTHQAWGKNKETVFVDEIDKENGKIIHNFFNEFFPDVEKVLPKDWYNYLRKNDSNWRFKYTVKKYENSGADKVLLNDFFNEKELFVWSPYIDLDMVKLKKQVNYLGRITLIPGFKNNKIILTEKEFDELSKYFDFKQDERNSVDTFVHGKLWLSDTMLCIGSWNFTKSAICGDNFEAGIIIEENFTKFKEGLTELKIEDKYFMTESELKEEKLPEPNKLKFKCTVIVDWLTRQYNITIICKKSLIIKLPDSEIKINNEYKKIVPIEDIRKIGTKRFFEVYQNEKKIFTGYIQEINTDYRPVYGFTSLNELLNNFSFNSSSNNREGTRYIYKENGEESDNYYQLEIENDNINYYSLFYITESLMLKIKEIEKNDENIEEKLSAITYLGANSVEQLVFLAKQWIESNIDNKLVMCWFLYNELNKLVQKINGIIDTKKLVIKKLNEVKLNKNIIKKFKDINKMNQKWIEYVRD